MNAHAWVMGRGIFVTAGSQAFRCDTFEQLVALCVANNLRLVNWRSFRDVPEAIRAPDPVAAMEVPA